MFRIYRVMDKWKNSDRFPLDMWNGISEPKERERTLKKIFAGKGKNNYTEQNSQGKLVWF